MPAPRTPSPEGPNGFDELGLGGFVEDETHDGGWVPRHRSSGRRAATTKRRPKITAFGVFGEVLLTMGVIMLLFVGWKYWLNDLIVGNEQNQAGASLTQDLEQMAEEGSPAEADDSGVPVLPQPTETNQQFAVLYVPAWGADYSRPIAQGVDYYDVLDENLGHYPQSDMPGAVGNFVIAGHRLAYGASMQYIHELQIGDEIVVETADGWYTYVYRSGEYVAATQIDVLDDVPRAPDSIGSDRIMTLQSCNPFWSTAERIIAYAVFDSFTPRADGPPASVAGAAAEGV